MNKLETIRDFIKDKRTDIKQERQVMNDKFQADGYENKYEYWNRFNEIRGEVKILKQIDSFVRFQLDTEKYSPYKYTQSQLDSMYESDVRAHS